MAEKFPGLIIDDDGGKPRARFTELTVDDLPNYDTLVEVAYSTMNYKDGLAITGKGRIARRLPMVAGIDLAGTVVESGSDEWQAGDRVVVNGWGLSETEWGGYARFQRIKSQWLTRVPAALTLMEAMAIGTAGYTAALCVEALDAWGTASRGSGEVLVTGAAGGVGSIAISLLSRAGFTVSASTRRPQTHDYLSRLGAADFVAQETLATAGSPLQKERWSGVVDSVGSTTLVNAIAQTRYGGAVAACGLAGGSDLPGTVLPHILRGVALLGIDSVYASHAERNRAWERLDRDMDREKLKAITRLEPFAKVPEVAEEILRGQVRGRVVIDLSAA